METAIVKATGKRVQVWNKDNQGLWWDERNYMVHSSQIRQDLIYKPEDLIFVKVFYTRENEKTLMEIRDALVKDGYVEVHNQYETFYGVGFDGWLRRGLEDIPCEIEVLWYNQWEGYPWAYFITRTGDIDELAGGAPSPKHNSK